MWETQVWSLGWEDSLEKKMVNLPREMYSCLENSTDRGAWHAIVQIIRHDYVTNTFNFIAIFCKQLKEFNNKSAQLYDGILEKTEY